MTAAPATEATITLTESQLKALLAEAAAAVGGGLPPGAYRENGRVYRDVWVPATGKIGRDGRFRPGRRKVKRLVHVTADMTPGGILTAKRAAYQSNPPMDFWHPDWGWLRNGSKREVEHPSNAGSDQDTVDVVYDDVDETEDQDPVQVPPPPVQVPEPDPETAPEPEAAPIRAARKA